MDNPIRVTEEELAKINAYAVTPLTADEVYCFRVLLCDNEIDRDSEKFSAEALEKLSELFVGRTGIFDHDPKGSNQTARIYRTEVRSFPERKTADGEEYRALMANAYMVRTEDNRSLIAEIDGGIKKEVSVSCSVGRKRCSVCGANRLVRACSHLRGAMYAGKICYSILEDPTDAYEWSFVAVPAQRSAGVAKSYSAIEDSEAQQRGAILSELIRLSIFTESCRDTAQLRQKAAELDLNGLCALREEMRQEAARRCADTLPQPAAQDNSSYKL